MVPSRAETVHGLSKTAMAQASVTKAISIWPMTMQPFPTWSAILHQLQKNIIIIIFMMVLPQEPLSFQVFPMDTMLPIFLRQPPEKEKMKSSVRSLLQFHRIILIFRFRFIPI